MAEYASEQPSMSRTRLSDAVEVQSILHRPDANEQETPNLVESTTGQAPPFLQSRSSSTSSRQSLARSLSTNDTSRRNKRLSVTFPIQTGIANSYSRVPPSPTRSNAPSSASIPEDLASPTGPADSGFLTALAAQERRVLELREELGKAELELRKLKREWAAHEAQKKRHDVRRVHKMRPVSLALPSPSSRDDDVALRAQEVERKKALLNGNKTSSRTVFSGSRHARTLSLLAPMSSGHAEPPVIQEPPVSERLISRPQLPHRPSTNPDLTREVDMHSREDIELDIPGEVLLRTGKQMASDFKDGLWTFIEDLRQATVGEEAVNGTDVRVTEARQTTNIRTQRDKALKSNPQAVRKQQNLTRQTAKENFPPRNSSKATKENGRLVESSADLGGSFWKDNGLKEPTPASTPRKHARKISNPHNMSSPTINESWDMWDSPVADRKKESLTTRVDSLNLADLANDTAGHDTTEQPSPPTNGSSDQAIPWPKLIKLAPSNLRRTASHLMDEWEKSLTDPADPKGPKATSRSATGKMD